MCYFISGSRVALHSCWPAGLSAPPPLPSKRETLRYEHNADLHPPLSTLLSQAIKTAVLPKLNASVFRWGAARAEPQSSMDVCCRLDQFSVDAMCRFCEVWGKEQPCCNDVKYTKAHKYSQIQYAFTFGACQTGTVALLKYHFLPCVAARLCSSLLNWISIFNSTQLKAPHGNIGCVSETGRWSLAAFLSNDLNRHGRHQGSG